MASRRALERQRGPGKAKYRGVPVAELLADYRLALVSRCLDDREITLQKQSRGFFHISGAGHEALCLGLARSLRPSYDWFLPYYRDRSLVLALGVTPTESLLQAVGAATDPASGGRQMPCHFGSRRLNILTQSSPTGSQCLPAVGCAEAGRYISRHSHEGLPGCSSHDDEIVYVSMGEGRDLGGRVLGKPQYGVLFPPPGALRSSRQRLCDIGACTPAIAGADLGPGEGVP